MNKYGTHLSFAFKAFIISQFIQLFSLQNLSAQSKLVDGYIITNKSDTIHGLIKNEEWTRSPESIQFKIGSEKIRTISAFDLKGFCINSNKTIYKSRKVGVLDITLTQLYIETPSLETKDSVQIFLQEIVSGDGASLYEFLNETEKSHLFIEKNGLIQELFNYSYYLSVGNKTHLLVLEPYKSQLIKICADSGKLNLSVPPYQIAFLKKYIEEYNRTFLASDKI